MVRHGGQSIHWFNPLIYIVSKQIDTECEVSCDVAVTEKMSEQEKNDYMRMILSLVERSRGCPQPLTTQMAGTKKMLIRRFDAIRSGKTTGKIMSAVSFAAAFALFTTTAFAGSVLSENHGQHLHGGGERRAGTGDRVYGYPVCAGRKGLSAAARNL